MLVLCLCVLQLSGQRRKPIPPVKSAYERQDEGPGKMQLLPGYVAGLPERWSCIDTECGFIWSPQGLTINYDIGELAGPGLAAQVQDGYLWYGEAEINGQVVRYAVMGSEKPKSLYVSFPKSFANFNVDIRSEAELRTALTMLLTYRGEGYRQETQSSVDGRVLSRNGVPVAGMEVALAGRTKENSAKTDARGHFHFLALPPGVYELKIQSSPGSSCRSSRRWTLKIAPAQLLLRTFPVPCTLEGRRAD